MVGGGRIYANGDLYILEEIDTFSTQGGIENTKMITKKSSVVEMRPVELFTGR